MMGRIAHRLADICIVTSDNPRSEAPNAIIDDVLDGIPPDSRSRVVVKPDRREAILEACRAAHEGDMVVVAGKGHETSQIFASHTIEFDDRAVVRELLSDLGYAVGEKGDS